MKSPGDKTELEERVTIEKSLVNTDKGDIAAVDLSLLPKIGDTVNGFYRIVEQIGTGGMSVVFKAEHLAMRKFVAIKYLAEAIAQDPIAVQRFQTEAQALGALDHPTIAAVLDFGVDQERDLPYLIMEYLEGQTLAELIQINGSLPPTDARDIAIQLADALAHAHDRKVIHRDLKPSNIIVQSVETQKAALDTVPVSAGDLEQYKYKVKIMDFGIAKILQEEGGTRANLTGTQDILGSPDYMSPEQCLGKQTDGRTDIYSLGCVLFEMLTGKPPYRCETPVQTILRHIGDYAPDFGNTSMPQNLRGLIESCLQKKAEDRLSSMTQVKQALASNALLKVSLPARLKKLSHRARHDLVFSGAIVLLLIGVGAIIYNIADNNNMLSDYHVRDQKSAEDWYQAGRFYHVDKRFEKAIPLFNHAIAIKPMDKAYSRLANAYFETGQFKAAIIAAQKAVDLNPKHSQLRRFLADYLDSDMRFEDAGNEYQKAVSLAGSELERVRKDYANARAPGKTVNPVERLAQDGRLKAAEDNLKGTINRAKVHNTNLGNYKENIDLTRLYLKYFPDDKAGQDLLDKHKDDK
ncbi:MAG: protein kinase [Candidatus Obscuribacter sp.]|jgi:serine/threonine protein kinase|nr:protein kinase [Candidatus Obscuribacter sp.]MBK9773480.1 protein kinase [Candidatus Obscuribacter sp.]MDQ5967483.1 Non-specific serine/threonine protein kinase [Cyanobacteriota bacterium erpe_2018_sw_39hr_WHONDRS-SW48-000098_B_bin.30]